MQEHIDIQFGKQGQPLLRSPWMRQAIMMGIDRKSIIKTVYGDLAGNTTPLNSIIYYPSDAAYKPDFAKWNFNPTEGARAAEEALHRRSVEGRRLRHLDLRGLSGEVPATRGRRRTRRAPRRRPSSRQQLKDVGIEIVDASLPANVFFGPTGIPSCELRPRELRAGSRRRIPARYVPIWGCGGESNYLGYCNRAATRLMEASNSELDPTKRTALFQGRRADGERRPVDPAVLAADPADLEVGPHRPEEQRFTDRLRLEHGAVALEVLALD